MAKRRLKLTAFSRFLLVMVFLVPLAYIGASYYNGEDGIENLKELIGLNETQPSASQTETTEIASKPARTSTNSAPASRDRKMQELEEEVELLKSEILKLKTEIAELKSR